MCLMITKPASARISKQYLKDAFIRNPDGAGFAYATGSRVKVIRPMWKFKDFYKWYLKHEHVPMLIHFRLATHGSMNDLNTHPHPITRKLAMAHNGVISSVKTEGDESDTRAFIRTHVDPIVSKHGPASVVEAAVIAEYEKVIGSSKLSFLTASGLFHYANKDLGHEHAGCWWSNNSYKEDRVRYNYSAWDYGSCYTPAKTAGSSTMWGDDWWSKSPKKCVACGTIRQRRDVTSFQFRKGELLPQRERGLLVSVCDSCMEECGGDTRLGFPTLYREQLDQHIEDLAVEELELKPILEQNANGVLWEESCNRCGRTGLRSSMQKLEVESHIKGVGTQANICSTCLGELGVPTYDPVETKFVAIDSPIAKELEATAALVATLHDEKIAKQRNQLCTIYHPGFYCEMCGLGGLTTKLPCNTRMCSTCLAAYRDNNHDWTRTAQQLVSDMPSSKVACGEQKLIGFHS